MASAREVRAAVRAQLAQQLNARQDAALAVAAAWSKITKAQARLATAETDARAVIADAVTTMPLGELGTLAGVPAADLRRLTRKAKTGATPETTTAALVFSLPKPTTSQDGARSEALNDSPSAEADSPQGALAS
jgi:hypothetical protein